MQLLEKYGNLRGVYNLLRMSSADGTWERVFTTLLAQADDDEELNWVVSVDSMIVRAHQHAARARKKGPRPASRTTMPLAGPRPADHEDPSRSRRRLPTPGLFHLTAGQAGDAPAFVDVMARLRVLPDGVDGPGPRQRQSSQTRPTRHGPSVNTSGGAASERSYSCRPINTATVCDAAAGGAAPTFDREAYKQRNTV